MKRRNPLWIVGLAYTSDCCARPHTLVHVVRAPNEAAARAWIKRQARGREYEFDTETGVIAWPLAEALRERKEVKSG